MVEEKDYLTHMKESGYRSYHMIVLYHVETLDGPKDIRAEIQMPDTCHEFLGYHRTFPAI